MQTDNIIKDLGNKAMTVMFGNDDSSNLDTLRYNYTLVQKIQHPSSLFTLSVCHLHHPLPNSTASEFTTKLWSGWVLIPNDGMEALEWGWKVDNNQMVPIMTDMKAVSTSM